MTRSTALTKELVTWRKALLGHLLIYLVISFLFTLYQSPWLLPNYIPIPTLLTWTRKPVKHNFLVKGLVIWSKAWFGLVTSYFILSPFHIVTSLFIYGQGVGGPFHCEELVIWRRAWFGWLSLILSCCHIFIFDYSCANPNTAHLVKELFIWRKPWFGHLSLVLSCCQMFWLSLL